MGAEMCVKLQDYAQGYASMTYHIISSAFTVMYLLCIFFREYRKKSEICGATPQAKSGNG